MSMQQRGTLIGNIMTHLRFHAKNNKAFDEGSIFFGLAFKDDQELNKIAKLSGC
jgi:hypothetical protein